MLRLTLFAFLVSTVPALAQTVAFGGMTADTKAPVELSADALSVDQASGSATFSGNVVIGQGEMRLSAQKVQVIYADDKRQRISSLHAIGQVTLVNGAEAAEAAEAEYSVEDGIIILSGEVIMTQGQNVLRGDRMQVNLADGTAQVDGRVRSVLQPGGN